jgi:thioredoxin-related protein
MRRVVFTVLVLLLLATTVAAQKSQKASDMFKVAETKAADQNKSIFLIFGASWCEACHQLDTFLALPDIAAIIDQHFVVARITFGEGAAGHADWDTPGSDTLIAKYGGISSSGAVGLPFIALLDAKAKLIVNSNAPTKTKGKNETTGFPTEPDEIKWFLSMLEKAAPALTSDDIHKLEGGLRQAAAD